MMRKLLALACVLMLLPLAALGEIKKEEIVYAKLSSGGEVQAMYIVNAFESDGEEAITDYGAYAARVNLSDETALPQTGDSVELSLSKGRFYYQGDGLQKALPWVVSIKYSLDGVDMTAEEIAGKSGDIALDFSVTPNAEATPVSGITLQATVTLPGETCLNIQAQSGIVAVSGGNRIVNYAILPGMSANYRITFTATDFSMPGIQIGGVRMAMDALMYAEAFTQSMDEAMKPLARNMAQSMILGMAGGDAVSFADERNKVENIQFVLMTEGVSLPEAAKAPEAAQAEEGFFDRLLHLFGL